MNEEVGKAKPLLKDSRAWVLIAASATIGIVIGVSLYGKLWRLPPAWGDIPTWLAVVVASVGGWIALTQFGDLRRQVTEEARRNKKRDELLDKQIAEANAREAAERRRLVEDVDTKANHSQSFVINNSKRPIADLACKLMSEADRHALATADACGEMMQMGNGKAVPMPQRGQSRLKVLRPGASCSFLFTDLTPGPDQVVVTWFTDDAGFRWQVDEYMHLVQSGDEGWYAT